jgi:hypothetical protein
MKIKTFMMAVALMAVLPISIQAAQLNPQPEPPRSLSGMSAAQFKALPDTAVFETPSGRQTKGQIMQKFEQEKRADKAKLQSDASRQQAARQRAKADRERRRQAEVAAENNKVRNKMAGFGRKSILGSRDQKTKPGDEVKTKPSAPPMIIQNIYGTVTPGSQIGVKGSGFGDPSSSSKVELMLKKPDGTPLSFRLYVQSGSGDWSDDGIIAAVDDNSVGGTDQQATVVVTRHDGQKAMVTVAYKAAITTETVSPSLVTNTACANPDGSIHNDCSCGAGSPYSYCYYHKLFPGSGITSMKGTDSWRITPLKNGWVLKTDCNGRQVTNEIVEPWMLPGSPYYLGVVCAIEAEGPKGVPMQ